MYREQEGFSAWRWLPELSAPQNYVYQAVDALDLSYLGSP
jgi:hypothetical protein